MTSLASIFSTALSSTNDAVSEDIRSYPRGDCVKFTSDPLALVLHYRCQGLANWEIGSSLLYEDYKNKIVDKEFFRKAIKIKKYYRNKFMIKSLKDNASLSQYRQHLYNYVDNNDPYTIFKNDIPMIVKLPDFYEEDTMMDDMVKKYQMTSDDYRRTGTDTVELFPLEKSRRKTRHSDNFYYWFRDSDNLIYRISLDTKNVLMHLFDREFQKPSLHVFSTFCATRTRGQDYVFYSLHDWKIL